MGRATDCPGISDGRISDRGTSDREALNKGASENLTSQQSSGAGKQMPLFASVEPEARKRQIAVNPGSLAVNPHLQAARRLSRKIRRLPDHSLEQTQAGLAIFQHLRALLQDASEHRPPH